MSVYLTTLSSFQILQHQISGRLVQNELGIVWREAFVATSISFIFTGRMEGLRQATENFSYVSRSPDPDLLVSKLDWYQL